MSAIRPTNLQEASLITFCGHSFEKLNEESHPNHKIVIEQLFNLITKQFEGFDWRDFLCQNKDRSSKDIGFQKNQIKRASSNDLIWMKLVVDLYLELNPQVIVEIKIYLNLLKDAEDLADKIEDDLKRDNCIRDIAFAYLEKKNNFNFDEAFRLSDKVTNKKFSLEILYGSLEKNPKKKEESLIDDKIQNIFHLYTKVNKKKFLSLSHLGTHHVRVHSCS